MRTATRTRWLAAAAATLVAAAGVAAHTSPALAEDAATITVTAVDPHGETTSWPGQLTITDDRGDTLADERDISLTEATIELDQPLELPATLDVFVGNVGEATVDISPDDTTDTVEVPLVSDAWGEITVDGQPADQSVVHGWPDSDAAGQMLMTDDGEYTMHRRLRDDDPVAHVHARAELDGVAAITGLADTRDDPNADLHATAAAQLIAVASITAADTDTDSAAVTASGSPLVNPDDPDVTRVAEQVSLADLAASAPANPRLVQLAADADALAVNGEPTAPLDDIDPAAAGATHWDSDPLVVVAAHVTDEDGDPIAGARMDAEVTNVDAAAPEFAIDGGAATTMSATSDSRGDAIAAAAVADTNQVLGFGAEPSGDTALTVTVDADGYQPAEVTITGDDVAGGAAADLLSVELDRDETQPLTLTAVDQDGDEVTQSGTVTVVGDGEHLTSEQVDDLSEATVEVDTSEAETLEVTVEADGYQPAETSTTAADLEDTIVVALTADEDGEEERRGKPDEVDPPRGEPDWDPGPPPWAPGPEGDGPPGPEGDGPPGPDGDGPPGPDGDGPPGPEGDGPPGWVLDEDDEEEYDEDGRRGPHRDGPPGRR